MKAWITDALLRQPILGDRAEAACQANARASHEQLGQRWPNGVLDAMRAASQACTSPSTQATLVCVSFTRNGKLPFACNL